MAVSVGKWRAAVGRADGLVCMCRATVNSQANYEKSVFAKTSRTNARQEGEGVGCAQGSGHSSCSLLALLTLLPSSNLTAAEIIMFDDYLVVYKQQGDLMFYVTGSLAENELILYSVLQAFYEATAILLR